MSCSKNNLLIVLWNTECGCKIGKEGKDTITKIERTTCVIVVI